MNVTETYRCMMLQTHRVKLVCKVWLTSAVQQQLLWFLPRSHKILLHLALLQKEKKLESLHYYSAFGALHLLYEL